MSERWMDGGNALWFVLGENKSIWLSTASFSRKGAIAQWEKEAGGYWRRWYRKGFRCRQVRIKYQPLPRTG